MGAPKYTVRLRILAVMCAVKYNSDWCVGSSACTLVPVYLTPPNICTGGANKTSFSVSPLTYITAAAVF